MSEVSGDGTTRNGSTAQVTVSGNGEPSGLAGDGPLPAQVDLLAVQGEGEGRHLVPGAVQCPPGALLLPRYIVTRHPGAGAGNVTPYPAFKVLIFLIRK